MADPYEICTPGYISEQNFPMQDSQNQNGFLHFLFLASSLVLPTNETKVRVQNFKQNKQFVHIP